MRCSRKEDEKVSVGFDYFLGAALSCYSVRRIETPAAAFLSFVIRLFFFVRWLVWRVQRRRIIGSNAGGACFNLVALTPLAKLSLIPGSLLVFLGLGLEMVVDSGRIFLFVPLLVNLSLFGLFAATLFRPPSIVEHVARIHLNQLTPTHMRYCRAVTALWCGFFAINGTISAVFGSAGSLGAWTIYNGLVSYLLIALLFAGEMTYRYWRFRVYAGSCFDPFFRKWFPSREIQYDDAHE